MDVNSRLHIFNYIVVPLIYFTILLWRAARRRGFTIRPLLECTTNASPDWSVAPCQAAQPAMVTGPLWAAHSPAPHPARPCHSLLYPLYNRRWPPLQQAAALAKYAVSQSGEAFGGESEVIKRKVECSQFYRRFLLGIIWQCILRWSFVHFLTLLSCFLFVLRCFRFWIALHSFILSMSGGYISFGLAFSFFLSLSLSLFIYISFN